MDRRPMPPPSRTVAGLTGGAGAEIWYNEDAVRRRLNTGTLPLSAIKFQEADT